jgi:hypothetical protein
MSISFSILASVSVISLPLCSGELIKESYFIVLPITQTVKTLMPATPAFQGDGRPPIEHYLREKLELDIVLLDYSRYQPDLVYSA